jgi:mannose/fructose/N-acetylgalactosamine-specific phosphotransferase system component IID
MLKMEEQNATHQTDVDAILSTRQSLMGTVSGFGDRVSQGAILPLLLSLGISIVLSAYSIGTVIAGVLTYLLLISLVMFAISAWCFFAGYNNGRDAVIAILGSARLRWWVGVIELCGAFMLGVLAASRGVTNLHVSSLSQFPPTVDVVIRIGLVAVFFVLVQRLRIKPTLILAGIVLICLLAGYLGVI